MYLVINVHVYFIYFFNWHKKKVHPVSPRVLSLLVMPDPFGLFFRLILTILNHFGQVWNHSGPCWTIFGCAYHYCFGAPLLTLGALLSTGATLSSFYFFVELGLLLYLLPAFNLGQLDKLPIKRNQHTCLK